MQQFADTVIESGIGKTDTLADQVVEVRFEVILSERAFDVITQMLENLLPVNSSQVGQVEDGFQVFGNLQESDVVETERAVGHDILELLAQGLDIFGGLQQVAAPINSG